MDYAYRPTFVSVSGPFSTTKYSHNRAICNLTLVRFRPTQCPTIAPKCQQRAINAPYWHSTGTIDLKIIGSAQRYYWNPNFRTFCTLLSARVIVRPRKNEKLAQCIPIYGTILGQCTRNCANTGPMFMVCRVY